MTNQFRAAVLAGKTPGKPDQLLPGKAAKGSASDDLSSVGVERDSGRTQDHRWNDRHRLSDEKAALTFRGERVEVDLVNLSAGGAMVRGDFEPWLWERVELMLGDGSPIECAVRWIRRDRFGLEFAHETQIDCDSDARDELLLDVIRRSFPDLKSGKAPQPVAVEEEMVGLPEAEEETRRDTQRHPLIWMGYVLYNHSSDRVRLRNISPTGALIEGEVEYPLGAELYLDLGEAGQVFAFVAWARGGQAGLTFREKFDLKKLALAKPTVTPQRWARPTFLRTATEADSPWANQWNRASLEELKAELEGYMKR